MSETTIIKR